MRGSSPSMCMHLRLNQFTWAGILLIGIYAATRCTTCLLIALFTSHLSNVSCRIFIFFLKKYLNLYDILLFLFHHLFISTPLNVCCILLAFVKVIWTYDQNPHPTLEKRNIQETKTFFGFINFRITWIHKHILF